MASTLLMPEPVQSRPSGAPWVSLISVSPDNSGSEAASAEPADGSESVDHDPDVSEEETGEAGAVSVPGAKAQSGPDGDVRGVREPRGPLSADGSGFVAPRPVDRGAGAGSVRGASLGAACWTGRASCQTPPPGTLPMTAEGCMVSTGCPESPVPDRSAGKSVHHTLRPSRWASRSATSPASAGCPVNARTTGVVSSLRVSMGSCASSSTNSRVDTPAVSPS